uniref:Uncharacterized protein n=1 Tax=Tetranychus urticae TaxID=32264 RepID=T1KSR8_TETUR
MAMITGSLLKSTFKPNIELSTVKSLNWECH